ncbi:class I SAM-dependent methyltransferase [Kribbella sp. NBC_01505]|uniref:class I SAM-dependent methyltransferase n=1 Tax=Kribbella sp. NBC_01505 TaxID=2903580 RepID=UPI003865C86E
MTEWNWQWDPNLYAGSANHYAIGRMAYPPSIGAVLKAELGLDGTGRLLDVGCGPGPVTRLLAPLFAEAVGVDADADMIAVASAQATDSKITWLTRRAEELSEELGRFRVVTFAQSFHWMNQPLVAELMRKLLEPGGAWVHLGTSTHRGELGENNPPWDAIDELVARYLGSEERDLPRGTKGGEDDVMRAAGYTGPTEIVTGGGVVDIRTVDEVMSAVLSLSSSTPHLFGARLPDFERDLRALLEAAASDGRFGEPRRPVTVKIWR